MGGFLPDFGNFGFTVLAFVVALSVVVAVHEYGHYIVGRWCGIRAEVFSLGFGPRLWSRVDRHGTRWQIAALPLGGYVKFLGDSDAASGRDGAMIGGLSDAERRHTMHGAPLWARAATVAAGPVFNFVLSAAVFSVLIWISGILPDRPVVGQVFSLPGHERSLQPGDLVTAIDGQPTPDMASFMAVVNALPPADSADYVVERHGVATEFTGPFPFPPRVDQVSPLSAAAEAGLQVNDLVLRVDGAPVRSFTDIRERVNASEGRAVDLVVLRDGTEQSLSVTPRRTDLPLAGGGFEARWLLGLSGGMVFVPEMRRPGPVEALGYGISQVGEVISTSVSGLTHMISGAISSCNLQGPLGIAETSGAVASMGVMPFIWFIAVLSTAIGFMNLFPIPVLDGGHLLFHAWEAVTGKPPSDGVVRVLMSVGLTLLLGLMLFALRNDLMCP